MILLLLLCDFVHVYKFISNEDINLVVCLDSVKEIYLYFPPCIWNAEYVYMESCYLQIHAIWLQRGDGGGGGVLTIAL